MGGMSNHPVMIDVGAQYAAIEIRKHVAPLTATVIKADAAALELVPASMRKTHTATLKANGEAWNASAAALAPEVTTAEREAAFSKLRATQEAMAKSSAEVEAWLNDNIEAKLEEHAAAIPGEVEEALGHIAAAEAIGAQIATRQQVLSIARNRDGRRRWSSLARLKLPGAESLHNARVGFEALLPKPPIEYVPQAEYRRRRDAGQDMSLIRINHSPGGLMSRASTGWGDAG
jgi:hypothetical protein